MYLISKHLILRENTVWHSSFSGSLARWVSSRCLRFSLDRAPHVRPVPYFPPELGTYWPGYRQCRYLEQE